jgi:hypothetical protein
MSDSKELTVAQKNIGDCTKACRIKPIMFYLEMSGSVRSFLHVTAV